MASRPQQSGLLRWSHNRGRNGWDVPTDVPDTMSAEAVNVVLERGTLGRKRRGAAAQTFTGDSFTGYVAVFRFVPGQDDAAAQTHAVSNDGTTKIVRISGGTSATALTLADAVTVASAPFTRAAALNGKLFYAHDSTVNRLHVYDPSLSTTTVRRVGLATPAAPTAANTAGAGSYAATARTYRVQWRVKSGSTILRQSLLGPSVSFTPSGSKDGVTVTQPTVASEGETHWAVYGAASDGVYYQLGADVAIGTTTYTDQTAPADYDAGTAAPDEGAFTPFPSVKMLVSTGDRLLGFGVWETSAGDSVVPKDGRVYFTPVLDTSDYGDDERLSNSTSFQGWIDVSRNSGGEDRALVGPMDGVIYAFQSKGIAMLVPTGEANNPYRRVTLSRDLGAVSQESSFVGEDEQGRPCLYWLDPARGPYRYGANGLQWLGHDIQDVWATINLAATTRVATGLYDPELRAAIWAFSTGSANICNELCAFFVREGRPVDAQDVIGGWVRWIGASDFGYYCSALLPETFGATMSRTLKPYFGGTSLHRWNDDSATQDPNSTSFRGYVTSKAYGGGAFFQRQRLGTSYLQAGAASGVTITQSLTRNFGDETARTATVSLTAAGSETRVIRKFEAAALADILTVQVTLGDASASSATWTLDEWAATIEPTEAL